MSECGQLLAAEHRLKGDRNAYEEIWAGAAFDGRMRRRLCLRCDRMRTSAAGVCAFPDTAAAARLQSIQPQCRASTELQTNLAHNTKHRSK